MAQHRVLTIMPTEGTTKLIETERRFVFGKEVPCIERCLTKLLEEASLKFGCVGMGWTGQALLPWSRRTPPHRC